MWNEKGLSVGKPTDGVKIKIIDEDFKSTKSNTKGIIAIKSEWMARGYLNEDADKDFRDGWLITDDIGYIDNLGYLHFVSRKSDSLIIDVLRFREPNSSLSNFAALLSLK